MGNVTVTFGLQPGDMKDNPTDFLKNLGGNTNMVQGLWMHDEPYSEYMTQLYIPYFEKGKFLLGMDSHQFNNWDDDTFWKGVLDRAKQIATYVKSTGARGIVVDCEQENHLIPFGPGGRYQRSDPQYVWPDGKNGPVRCRAWVDAVKSVWPEAEIHLWLTSAVQVNANPGLYPCINAICEQAKGAHLWLYMWEVGYQFGINPNLPKKKTLPNKYLNGKSWAQIGDYNLWEKAALSTFTQKVKNTIHPVISFSTDSVDYYQKQIKAKQVKDFSPMMDYQYVNLFKGSKNPTLVIWGNVFRLDPAIYGYTQNLIKQLRG